MATRTTSGEHLLTEKEKQTLRLIVRGHDAKSIARQAGLSVHTVNERLRNARRKLAVSSSREAARLLLDREGRDPDSLVSKEIGEARTTDPMPHDIDRTAPRLTGISIGVVVMTVALGLVLLVSQPHQAATPIPAAAPAVDATNAAIEASARQWLTLVDQERWDDSWKATGTAFRKLNTAQVWANASKRVRSPLGAMISRTLISQENLPAPPDGYEVVKYRTAFANKADAVETVTLEREDGGWRVVGVTII